MNAPNNKAAANGGVVSSSDFSAKSYNKVKIVQFCERSAIIIRCGRTRMLPWSRAPSPQRPGVLGYTIWTASALIRSRTDRQICKSRWSGR